ncbi:MAG: hypothetical protein Q8N18_26555 [Opitutaceae bacterium]|nr:hypothetical protein [Opitutaceae bacterium]
MAALNPARRKFVHADAFAYTRQMQQNGEKWDVVNPRPAEVIFTRDDHGNWEGRQKYEDLNLLALSAGEARRHLRHLLVLGPALAGGF